MSYAQFSEHDNYQGWWTPTDPNYTLASILAAAGIGTYALFQVLELLGFPVWFWIHQVVYMFLSVLHEPSLDTPSAPKSSTDTMQRGSTLASLFGLNNGGSLLQKGVRGVQGIAGAFSSGSSNVPPGLGNTSNSCYQNSVIQGLASLPSLRNYLEQMTAEHPFLTTETTNGALCDMISKLNDPQSFGQHFWVRGKLKSMSTFQQQDAQEYYSKVLDALDEEVKKASSKKTRSSFSWLEATKSISDVPDVEAERLQGVGEGAGSVQMTVQPTRFAPNPLDGLLAQRVGCISCGYSEGLSLIPFNCITVALGRNYSYDIRDCLDEYTTLEMIDGVECAKCTLLKLKSTLSPLAANNPGSPFETKLNAVLEALDDEDFDDKTLIKTFNISKKNWVQSTKSKQAVIARAPKSLVLHVNRSEFDERTGMPSKNSAGVEYPESLDLGNWCLGSHPSRSQHPDMSIEEWPRDPRESMLLDTQDPPLTTSPFQYKLRAAVTHYGSHGNGHYVCYRPHPKPASQSTNENDAAEVVDEKEERSSEEQWWRFSDDSVYPIRKQDAHQGNVFMLFYERIDDFMLALLHDEGAASQTFRISEDAPLPPAVDVTSQSLNLTDDGAAEVPLPEDDNLFELVPLEPSVLQSAPPPLPIRSSTDDEEVPTNSIDSMILAGDTVSETVAPDIDSEADTETSETESENAPSTQLTWDSEADDVAPPTPKVSAVISPHLMRTAGNATSRGQGSRQSLPMVSAT